MRLLARKRKKDWQEVKYTCIIDLNGRKAIQNRSLQYRKSLSSKSCSEKLDVSAKYDSRLERKNHVIRMRLAAAASLEEPGVVVSSSDYF